MDKEKQARAEVKAHGLITVRTLRPKEGMPQHMNTGFEQLPVMNEFVWVAEKEGKVIGMLMASPCHGLIFFVRLRTEKKAPAMTVPLLFRKCVKDCLERGFLGYFTFVDPSLDAERRFIPICHRAGGTQITSLQVGLVGKLQEAARF